MIKFTTRTFKPYPPEDFSTLDTVFVCKICGANITGKDPIIWIDIEDNDRGFRSICACSERCTNVVILQEMP